MADVYHATRSDGVHDQTVALKIIRGWGDTAELVERMNRERKLLSQFTHPNIATFLDGGNSDNGRPYFVLEYIAGKPITEYCQEKKLGLKERLQLFLPVCSAVYAAHSKLILHRDLKPNNILVTDDGVSNVRTKPAYRAVCEDDILPPSACMAENKEKNKLEKKRLIRLLKGDLDAIVMKAIHKDPERRYASVQEFSEDINRYLENKMVLAQRRSFRYWARQYTKRNRRKVVVLTGFICIIATVTIMQQTRIIKERNQAILERNKYEQTQDFLLDLFEISDPEKNLPQSITAREILDRGVETIRDKFSAQPKIKNALLFAMGKANFKLQMNDAAFEIFSETLERHKQLDSSRDETLAVILSHLASLSIGEGKPLQAERYIQEALEIFSSLQQKKPKEWVFAYSMAGEVAYGLRKIEESTLFYQTALKLSIENFGEDAPNITGIYANLSENFGYIFDFDESLKYNKLALAQAAKDPDTSNRYLPKIYNVLGVIYWWQEDFKQALDSFNKAIEISIDLYGDHTASVVEDYMNVATIYQKTGDYNKSLEFFNKAMEVLKFNDNLPVLAKTHTSMSRTLIFLNKFDEAMESALKGLEIKKRIYDDKFSEPFALSYHLLGTIYEKKGETDKAVDFYKQANNIRVKLYGDDHKWTRENAAALLRLQK